jgi:hypothetical protein
VAASSVVVLSLAGCAANETIKIGADGSPAYHNLQIIYDLASTPDLRRLDQPPRIDQTSAVELASNNQPVVTTRPWTRRRVHLELQYPYPGVHPAFARATLRIVTDAEKKPKPSEKPRSTDWKDAYPLAATSVAYSQPASGGTSTFIPAKKPEAPEPSRLPPEDQEDGDVTEEVLYIDLPKTELDDVLTELAKTDFFKRPSNPDGASHVVVALNKGRCEKGWTREEHLDRLIDMLRRHGAPLSATAAEINKP